MQYVEAEFGKTRLRGIECRLGKLEGGRERRERGGRRGILEVPWRLWTFPGGWY